MENWKIALINETRRRQEQIGEAEKYRLIRLAAQQRPRQRRIYQKLLLGFAQLLIEIGTRLQCRVAELTVSPAPGAEASPCSS
jgi:hypothetical protein